MSCGAGVSNTNPTLARLVLPPLDGALPRGSNEVGCGYESIMSITSAGLSVPKANGSSFTSTVLVSTITSYLPLSALSKSKSNGSEAFFSSPKSNGSLPLDCF